MKLHMKFKKKNENFFFKHLIYYQIMTYDSESATHIAQYLSVFPPSWDGLVLHSKLCGYAVFKIISKSTDIEYSLKTKVTHTYLIILVLVETLSLYILSSYTLLLECSKNTRMFKKFMWHSITIPRNLSILYTTLEQHTLFI